MKNGKPARNFESPFQLWGDLRCPALRPIHPVDDAAFEVYWRDQQLKQGVLRLSECHEEPPLG